MPSQMAPCCVHQAMSEASAGARVSLASARITGGTCTMSELVSQTSDDVAILRLPPAGRIGVPGIAGGLPLSELLLQASQLQRIGLRRRRRICQHAGATLIGT